jgi:hypothetical protein
MPHVEPVPLEKAGLEIAGLYEKVNQTFGFVPHYFQALRRIPELVDAQLKMRVICLMNFANRFAMGCVLVADF